LIHKLLSFQQEEKKEWRLNYVGVVNDHVHRSNGGGEYGRGINE